MQGKGLPLPAGDPSQRDSAQPAPIADNHNTVPCKAGDRKDRPYEAPLLRLRRSCTSTAPMAVSTIPTMALAVNPSPRNSQARIPSGDAHCPHTHNQRGGQGHSTSTRKSVGGGESSRAHNLQLTVSRYILTPHSLRAMMRIVWYRKLPASLPSLWTPRRGSLSLEGGECMIH